jgi:multisubunit Na+/H+ antiporter MnhE subunit
MINFTALFVVLFGLWLITHASPEAGPIAGALCAAVATLVSWRFGVPEVATRAPQELRSWLSRAWRKARGTWRVIRAALQADVTLHPALVRVRAPDASAGRLAAAIGGTPGATIVAEDADGVLIHVIDENEASRFDRALARGAKDGRAAR